MAQQLDLQEQEQIDALKAFWGSYGNLIIWLVTLVLLVVAGVNGAAWLKRSKSGQASTMYGALEAAAQAGDAKRAAQIFGDMKSLANSVLPRFVLPVPAYVQQGGLLAAKVENEKGQPADAMAALQWVVDNGNEENAAVARLRLAGLLADGKKYDEALKSLDAVTGESFKPLAADRRGDILLAKGDKDGAKKAYAAAYDGLGVRQDYRFVVEAKLTSLGAAPAVSAASAVEAAASSGADR